MATRKWKYYNEPGGDGIELGKMASGQYDTNLVRSACANYAETRRNVIALVYNAPRTIVCTEPDFTEWAEVISIPINERIVRPGTLTIKIRYSSVSEAVANKLHWIVSVGGDSTYSYANGNLAVATKTFTIELTARPPEVGISPQQRLEIKVRTDGANSVSVDSVGAYQKGDGNTPDFIDLDDANCVLGDADYPDSVFAMELLRNNVTATRGWKTVRANVFNHWWKDYLKQNVAYGANNDELGHYYFVKRRDVSELECHFLAGESCTGVSKVRMEITGTVNVVAPVETVVAGLGAAWYTATFTLVGVDITDESELELLVDAKDTVADATVDVPGLYLVESLPAAAIAYTNPDTLNTPQNSTILASTADNARTTMNHLWLYGGRQILVSDWRWGSYGDAYSNAFQCHRHTAGGWIKGSYGSHALFPAAIGLPSTVVRALLFSSTGSQRLRVKMGYKTSSGTTNEKYLQMQISDNLAFAVYDDADPAYDDSASNIHAFTRQVDGTDGGPNELIEACELDIVAGNWEESYDGVNEPPQVWISSLTGDAVPAEYVIPLWLTVEEIPLAEVEFP